MGYLTYLAVVLSVAFLLYSNPVMLRSLLPGWLLPGDGTDGVVTANGGEHTDLVSALHETEDEEAVSTPKAGPNTHEAKIPTFALSDEKDSKSQAVAQAEPRVPSFPAPNSAQRAFTMPPPPKPSQASGSALMPGLMLPPARPSVPGQNGTASLRVPSSGPLPNRGLPANSQQRISSSLSPSSTVSTPNPRGKVLLAPGHSPMDWAALIRSGNLSGVDTFQRVTPSQLRYMTGRKGKPAWSSWQGKVYNITPYLPFHPGGEAELMKAAGRDGTKLFMEVHPWVNWENMLGACLVGVLVPELHTSPLEEMD